MTKQYAQDREMSYEEAEYYCRLELETCRCPRDEGGYPSPANVNDLCEWHGEAIHRAIEDGRFWSEPWPWPAARLQAQPAAGQGANGGRLR